MTLLTAVGKLGTVPVGHCPEAIPLNVSVCPPEPIITDTRTMSPLVHPEKNTVVLPVVVICAWVRAFALQVTVTDVAVLVCLEIAVVDVPEPAANVVVLTLVTLPNRSTVTIGIAVLLPNVPVVEFTTLYVEAERLVILLVLV